MFRGKDDVPHDATARAMAVAVAGSLSGGESTHLASGSIHLFLSPGAGVGFLPGMSIAWVELGECGEPG